MLNKQNLKPQATLPTKIVSIYWNNTARQTNVNLFAKNTYNEAERTFMLTWNNGRSFLIDKEVADLEQNIEFMAAWEANPSKRKMTIEDAIIHLINHSSYHRGQIIVHIKGKVDILPLSTDIMYASEIIA